MTDRPGEQFRKNPAAVASSDILRGPSAVRLSIHPPVPEDVIHCDKGGLPDKGERLFRRQRLHLA